MPKRLQPGAINDAADYYMADIALRRGRMNMYQTEDLGWALQRLNDRVSFSGWFFAVVTGLSMWTLMFRMFI